MGVTVEDAKFDQPRLKAILEMISKHIPYKKACLANGVSEQAFYQWLAKGKKHLQEGKDSKHAQFLVSLSKIEANRIEQHINNIGSGENGHKGSQWILERVFWKDFSCKAAEVELNERVEALENKKADEDESKTTGIEEKERELDEESSEIKE